ncbi:MAG: phosphoadenylyl-sulfate reductase [Fibrobacteres bacterium]|nr:phosphoadenylyl-sulfate reductase [Fibrobacterota bacterium]
MIKVNNAIDVLEKALSENSSSRLVLATSFSVEDQTILHLLLQQTRKFRWFFLDTGRHYQETYDTLVRTREKYGIQPEIYLPDSTALSEMLNQKGPNSFYNNIENRKECCEIRKVAPLRKVLSTSDGWICGLRQTQALTRTNVEPFEWDGLFNLRKYNPLWNWNENEVWDYVAENSIPVNSLQRKGYRSIGCAPCTRAVKDDEDLRSGRWWWENPDQKECGLHKRGEK